MAEMRFARHAGRRPDSSRDCHAACDAHPTIARASVPNACSDVPTREGTAPSAILASMTSPPRPPTDPPTENGVPGNQMTWRGPSIRWQCQPYKEVSESTSPNVTKSRARCVEFLGNNPQPQVTVPMPGAGRWCRGGSRSSRTVPDVTRCRPSHPPRDPRTTERRRVSSTSAPPAGTDPRPARRRRTP